MKPHLEQAHLYWKNLLNPHDTVIDATCGNGKDTAYLATLVPHGKVIAIDVQEAALQKARQLRPPNTVFLHQSHTSFPRLFHVKLIVYNLGYLPGGDKTITTMTTSTLQSLEAATELIIPGGALSITCYPGHPEGLIEAEKVTEWAHKLNFLKWDVTRHQWRTRSPNLFFITKK